MDDLQARPRPSRARRAGGPAFDLVVSKLRRPPTRPGTVRRSSLIERLTRGDPRPVVTVVAPAGYGKTTLLSQWAERGGHRVAWVSVDERDNDPKVLLTYVAEALNAVEPVGTRVFDALASPVSSVPGSVVPRLGSAFAAMTAPVTLVLDDVHLLRDSECRAALSVLAGRGEPPVRVARLRAEGRILEIGPGELSLSHDEAAGLLRGAEVVLGEDDLAALYQRTEGWPAGLYLAALCLREGGALPSAVVSFGGDDRLVSDYVESEFLARISWSQRVFLTRTAVLERLSGPLSEAVLNTPGSAAVLADLARSNLLLVPLDRRGHWYRYHHLFRDMLLAELERSEPEVIPVLRRRAAAWCLRNALPEQALEYSIAAGDIDTAAGLVESLWIATDREGRSATALQRWIRWLDDQGGVKGHPGLAIAAAFNFATNGPPADAERWADAVDRWQAGEEDGPGDPATEAWAATLRASLCRHGAGQMRADAEEAVRRCAAANVTAPVTKTLLGIARILGDDLDAGDAALADAAAGAEEVGAHEILAITRCERALVAMARRDWGRAEALAGEASAGLARAGIEESYATPLVCAVLARAAWHRGDARAAHQELTRAQRLRSVLTYALPYLAVQVRIELTRVHLALADVAGARTLLLEVDDLLKRQPALGTLVGEAEALRARLAAERGASVPGASALTAAELRLLPLLSTHLSSPEIAGELFLSPHTIKSQMKSIYRKLGASARSEAVARAQELGLLEG